MHDILDTLCPMHLVLDETGHIVHMGPTLAKLLEAQQDGSPEGPQKEPPEGQRFLELFELRRPRAVQRMADLRPHIGATLHLRLRDATKLSLKGVLVDGTAPGQMIVNLSFGISIVEAVRNYTLTAADFAATDLAIEMLYLVEAKSAAMEASRKLNQRLQGAMIAAEEQAFTDTLTGLKNRRALDHILGRTLRYEVDFSMMHLDLDYFKAVNDTMGHAAGDHVLLEVARILVEETREDDTVARVGGDEFVLLFHGVIDEKKLADIAGRLISKLEKPIPFGEQVCRISGSIGIVTSMASPDVDLGALFEDADIALYASKHAGRARYTFYSPDLREGSSLEGVASKG